MEESALGQRRSLEDGVQAARVEPIGVDLVESRGQDLLTRLDEVALLLGFHGSLDNIPNGM